MIIILATKVCGMQQNFTDIQMKFLTFRILIWQEWLFNKCVPLCLCVCCKFGRIGIMLVLLGLANKGIDTMSPQYLKAKGEEILVGAMKINGH